MKPNGSASTLTVCRHKNAHFQEPISNGTLVPKLLHICGWSFTVPTERWLLLMLQTCPKHLSKSPCELCFSRYSCQNLRCSVFIFRLELRIRKSSLDRRVAYQKLWWKRVHVYEVRYDASTRSIRMELRMVWFVQELACHELLKQDCYTGAGTTWFFPPTELWLGRLFGKSSPHFLNRHTFHDLLYLHFFHSFALLLFIYHVCPSFCIHVLSFLYSCPFIYLRVFPFSWSKVWHV